MTPKEQFIAWLNDAYSMEMGLIPVLENHAKDAENHPEIRDRIALHAEETRSQADRLEALITGLGGTVSTVKSAIGSILGTGQALSTGMYRDEMTKNFLSDYAAEHFEIASYIALIATAEQIGEQQTVSTLREILAEEETMARWIEERIPLAVAEGLRKTTAASS